MIDVYTGIVANDELVGVDGYEFYGTFENIAAFANHIKNLPDGEKPSPFVGFRIENTYYDNELEIVAVGKGGRPYDIASLLDDPEEES